MPTTDLMTMLPVSKVKFIPRWRQEFSAQASGNPRVADLGPELWGAELTATDLSAAEQLQAEALIEQMRCSAGTFYCWNTRAQYPQADRNGAILGSNTVTIYALGGDNKSLRLAGLPVGYKITIGDMLAFDTGEDPDVRRCLHRFVAGGVADGAGRTPSIEVAPHIRAGAATSLVVTLKRPAAEMFILPGSYDSGSTSPTLGEISFKALQVP